jgi:DNA-binding response OmpR family regulator
VLREHGYRVLEARTGEEAHQLVAGYGGSIQLLVTDVVLPGMSGPELVDRLGRTLPALQTLFMSGYGQRAIAHHGVIDSGATLLEKPFTSEQLLTLVRAMLETTGQRSR